MSKSPLITLLSLSLAASAFAALAAATPLASPQSLNHSLPGESNPANPSEPIKTQENDKFKVNFGIHAAVSVPLGKINYKDYYSDLGITNGYGGGAFVEFAWSRWAVRGKFEYLDFEKYKNMYNADVKGNYTMTTIDGIAFTKAKYVNYIFAGLGVSKINISEWEKLGTGVPSEPSIAPALFYGLGWNLGKHYGIEIKHNIWGSSRIQVSVLLRTWKYTKLSMKLKIGERVK